MTTETNAERLARLQAELRHLSTRLFGDQPVSDHLGRDIPSRGAMSTEEAAGILRYESLDREIHALSAQMRGSER